MSAQPKLPPRSTKQEVVASSPVKSVASPADQVEELQQKIKTILENNPNVSKMLSDMGGQGALDAVQRLQLDSSAIRASSSSLASHPPLQPASFFRGNTATEGFTFTHQEKDVMLHDLPADAQARVISQSQAQHHASVAGASHTAYPSTEQKPDPRLLGAAYYEFVTPSMWKPEESPATVEATGDDFLGLYQRAYCIYADAAWPPVFFAIASLLSSLLFLPILATILILLLTFFIGIFCFVERLAGMKRKEIPLSRFVPSFIITLELSSLISYIWIVMPVWSQAHTVMGWTLLLTLIVLAPMHFYIMIFTDPGFIKPSQSSAKEVGGEDASKEESRLMMDAVPGPVVQKCPAENCGAEKRLRSKHCKVCGKCVRRLDHHCPAMYCCIGENNQRIFMAYIAIISLSQILFVWALLDFFSQEADLGENGGLFSSMLSASTSHRPLLFLAVGHMILLLASVPLNIRSWFCILSNLTTAELLKRLEIDYLNSELGYCNRFDRGMLGNAYQFWFDPRQNWEQEYQSGQSYLERNALTNFPKLSPGWILAYYDRRMRQKAINKKAKEEAVFQKIAAGEI